jgi:hypothetical protein
MALNKAATVVHDDATLTAGAADTVSATQTLTGAYQSTVRVRLTNGATGPTVAAKCKVQVAEADVAAKFMTLATVYGTTGNADVVEAVIGLPDTAQYLRLVSGSNTGQNVTLRGVLETLTAL